MKRLAFSGLMKVTMAGGPYDGRSFLVEPLGTTPASGLHGECLRARFRDSRGYVDEGDFRLDQIAAMQPVLDPDLTLETTPTADQEARA